MGSRSVIAAAAVAVCVGVAAAAPAGTAVRASGAPLPQGTQSNAAYAASGATAGVTNSFATTQRTSCFTPEVPFFASLGPALGYSGMSTCDGTSTTGEDLGPYPTQS